MSSRRYKKEILDLLAGSDLERILTRLQEMPAKDVVHALFSAICRSDEGIRWHGIRAMGAVVSRLAQEDMEEARVVMRRLLWSLNDESGGIGWGAPEALAEIMSCHRGLAEEYIHMLISYMRPDGEQPFQDGNFLEHEGLQRGLLWGMSRLAAVYPGMLLERGAAADLSRYLFSADPALRGLAALALGYLGSAQSRSGVEQLLDDTAPVRLYQDDRWQTCTVDALARQALARIQGREGG